MQQEFKKLIGWLSRVLWKMKLTFSFPEKPAYICQWTAALGKNRGFTCFAVFKKDLLNKVSCNLKEYGIIQDSGLCCINY